MPANLKLEASALEDYKLVHEMFTGMLLLADANKLLSEPHKLDHYLNGYMEHSLELSVESKKYKVDAKTLKEMRDKVIKEASEASIRAAAAARRAEDVEAALRGAIEENFWLLGVQEAKAAEIKKLKSQSMKEKELEAEPERNKAMLEAVEKKIAEV
ncbi:hypothetical protein COCNU_scaffold000827G000010 [Cocos nucifera]|nr:hypothetical protein [Cocos nucifera]